MFSPIKPKKISEIVIDQIRSEIIQGRLKPGDKLPGERELAHKMGVSRPPIREAIKQLIYAGFLETTQGDGTYVKSTTGPLFPDPLKEQIEQSKTSFLELARIRQLLEGWACTEAAKRRSEDQLFRLQEIVTAMSELPRIEKFVQLDLDFHRTIAEMSGNTIYLHLNVSISNLLIPLTSKYRGQAFNKGEDLQALYEVHRKIYEAIHNQDPEGAEQAMEKHIQYLTEIRLALDPEEDRN